MRKGFIGPIGDDLPSIIAIMLALGLFFSAVVYTLDTYNQKIADMDALKGSIEIGRVIMDRGILTEVKPAAANYVKESYGLEYDAYLDNDQNICEEGAYRFTYLVAAFDEGSIGLHRLTICTWK